VATIWLTTTDMGFALTDEQHMLLCPKDAREGKVIDRYLAQQSQNLLLTSRQRRSVNRPWIERKTNSDEKS
jgi:hypothetical protein